MTECHDLDHISEHYMSVDVHRRMLGRIADVTRSRRPRWLDVTDIIDIADDADVSDVPPQELADFRAVYLPRLSPLTETARTNSVSTS